MAGEKLLKHRYTDIEFIPTVATRVRYRDQIHLKNLYIMLREYFEEEGWFSGKDADWPEHYYLVRELPKGGKESWIWWRFKKWPTPDTNPKYNYCRYLLDIFWHINFEKDIEVIHNGKKYKTQNADLELDIRSYLEVDPDGKWKKHWLLKHFSQTFRGRMFKNEVDMQRHYLYRETYRLQEMLKQWLKLRTYMPEPEGQEFWPEFGVGDKPGVGEA